MKRWQFLILLLLVAGIGDWAYLHRQSLGLTGASPAASVARWNTVAHDGFLVEMPGKTKEIEVPAQNQSGGTDPVHMVVGGLNAATTFSIAWADNPPVVRANGGAPERILSMARDQALARTRTTPVSESPVSQDGLPARDLVAQNSGGGVLESRFVCAGQRLYMLTVAYPSMAARREQDVTRFFQSFKPSDR